VQEIIKPMEITKVPSTPQFLLGVINLRGVIVPIITLNSYLGFERTENIEDGEFLIVHYDKLVVGVSVSKVSNIINIPEKLIEIFPENIPLRQEKYILGLSIVYDKKVNLLDLHRVIKDAKASI
jgi:purine-binding chemotaxis protein CheW